MKNALLYGAIDLRLTPEGRYVFLEINPAGQFLYIENATGQQIAAAVARTLLKRRAVRSRSANVPDDRMVAHQEAADKVNVQAA
jgi:hypothetical protein